ncbi:MAG: ferrochelatase [Anaerolineae bacterium]|jgi:protoporphyrin/coproporphyrin ferrochelatase|nr:ferrochelatase [Anaerolineae bacterium]MBT7074440.1 ferrochelatase [Anaerolineae bacterium]MBT7783453.1 ferrochelatase [Anaerolineae bacterium]
MTDFNLGILLANTGTPDAPTPKAVRRFLAQFLADPRIIEIPRWKWLPILHGIILNTRPRKSAKLYENIWDERGSPLLYHMQDLAENLQAELHARLPEASLNLAIGMGYGTPSIREALHELKEKGATHLIILPLFPQYSSTTSGSIIESIFAEIKKWRWIPSMQVISDYHDHPAYISAMAKNVRVFWAKSPKPEKLMLSFHGIPKEYVEKGDPYEKQCLRTAELLIEKLALGEDEWLATFQSRFGRSEWLKPYTDKVLEKLGAEKLTSLDVLSPGFAVDCLETVGEIGDEGREQFQNAGGGIYNYIPALNATNAHVEALAEIILERYASNSHP